MADGHPDLTGTWDFRTIVPVQRPREMANKTDLTEDDIRELEEADKLQEAVQDQNPNAVYNRFWFDEGTTVGKNKRSSLITDPPDGRFPPLTAEGQRRAHTEPWNRNPKTERVRLSSTDNPEEVNLASRCIMGFNSGPPMLPAVYNNIMEIFHTKDNVIIHTEMVHTARIVPVKGGSHLPFSQWSGSSVGHWEGDTFIVETKGFKERGVGSTVMNTDANAAVVEKFTREDADTLRYDFMVNDPTVWTKPWSGTLYMLRTDDKIFEYACHEANYATSNMMTQARREEKEAEAKKKD